jgi:hypothetical protein
MGARVRCLDHIAGTTWAERVVHAEAGATRVTAVPLRTARGAGIVCVELLLIVGTSSLARA